MAKVSILSSVIGFISSHTILVFDKVTFLQKYIKQIGFYNYGIQNVKLRIKLRKRLYEKLAFF